MKKNFRKILVLLLAAVCLASGSMYAYGSFALEDVPTVIFDAKAKTFSFVNFGGEDITTLGGSAQTVYPDLFTDAKNLFPGDSVSQPVRFIVNNVGDGKVYLMLKAADGDFKNLDYETLTSESAAKLTIKFPDGRSYSDDLLLDSNGKKACSRGVYIGCFTSAGEQTDIELNLSLDINAGNEYQGLYAALDWLIIAEVFDNEVVDPEEPIVDPDKPLPPPSDPIDNPGEEPIWDPDPADPIDPVDPDPVPIGPPGPTYPKTGDNSIIWLITAAASGLGMLIFVIGGRRRKDSNTPA